MITPEKWIDIKLLHQQSLSQTEIAKRSGHARNTVAQLLEQKTPKPFDKRASCLDPYKPYLTARWEEYALTTLPSNLILSRKAAAPKGAAYWGT